MTCSGGVKACAAGYFTPPESDNECRLCGVGYYCIDDVRTQRSPGFCTYRTDGAEDPDGTSGDAEAPCGRLVIAPSALTATCIKPLKTTRTLVFSNNGGLPLTWYLTSESVPPWLRVARLDADDQLVAIETAREEPFVLAASESIELTLTFNSADTASTRANITVHQTQVWANPGEAAAVEDLPVLLSLELEIVSSTVLLLPQDNVYEVEINKQLPSKTLVIYNLQVKNEALPQPRLQL